MVDADKDHDQQEGCEPLSENEIYDLEEQLFQQIQWGDNTDGKQLAEFKYTERKALVIGVASYANTRLHAGWEYLCQDIKEVN